MDWWWRYPLFNLHYWPNTKFRGTCIFQNRLGRRGKQFKFPFPTNIHYNTNDHIRIRILELSIGHKPHNPHFLRIASNRHQRSSNRYLSYHWSLINRHENNRLQSKRICISKFLLLKIPNSLCYLIITSLHPQRNFLNFFHLPMNFSPNYFYCSRCLNILLQTNL